MADKDEIAQWLIELIRENGQKRTYQTAVVRELREKFGEEWLYKNHNHNWAIDPAVLKALRPLKDDHVIWDRADQSWRIVTDEQLEYIRERDARRAEARAARTSN